MLSWRLGPPEFNQKSIKKVEKTTMGQKFEKGWFLRLHFAPKVHFWAIFGYPWGSKMNQKCYPKWDHEKTNGILSPLGPSRASREAILVSQEVILEPLGVSLATILAPGWR